MSLLKKSRTWAVFYFSVGLLMTFSAQSQIYNNEQLESIAKDFVSAQVGSEDLGNKRITALPLDNRLPERQCQLPISKSTATEPPYNRQVTVQLKCDDIESWTQYVHVRIAELYPVVIATENLTRGEVITAAHLTVKMRPKQFVRVQHISDENLLIGSRSKRNIRGGLPLSLSQICMVCKGDNVTIIAQVGSLKIKTTGIALEDGTLDEQVRVQNKKSGKVVNARVDGVESVLVNI